MASQCPNCKHFKLQDLEVGKWEFGLWNFLPFFLASYMILGSPYKSLKENASITTELTFGLPSFAWGFGLVMVYTPFLLVRRYRHNKIYRKIVSKCTNCGLVAD